MLCFTVAVDDGGCVGGWVGGWVGGCVGGWMDGWVGGYLFKLHSVSVVRCMRVPSG